MKTVVKGPRIKTKFKLVRWEGEEPPHDKDHPEKHPACLEVKEWELGHKAETIYERSE